MRHAASTSTSSAVRIGVRVSRSVSQKVSAAARPKCDDMSAHVSATIRSVVTNARIAGALGVKLARVVVMSIRRISERVPGPRVNEHALFEALGRDSHRAARQYRICRSIRFRRTSDMPKPAVLERTSVCENVRARSDVTVRRVRYCCGAPPPGEPGALGAPGRPSFVLSFL